MKNKIHFLSIALAVAGCKNDIEKNIPEPVIPQLVIGDPAEYGHDSLIIFPVGMTYIPEQTGSPSTNYTGGYTVNEANGSSNATYNVAFVSDKVYNSYGAVTVYKNNSVEDVDIRNLIFYNEFTGESKKLLSEKLHIISFSIHYEFGDEPIIMYDVVKHDYNEDSLFDTKDPVMLYISDINGDNFTQLTPENETYLTYFYYKDSGRMLLKVSEDGDGNNQFDPYDKTFFREIDLKNPGIGKILFGEDMIKDLQDQL